MHNAEGVQLGVISKPNGLKGALNIIVNSEAADKTDRDNPLFIEIDGQRVPFFIEDLHVASHDHLVVKLEFINSIDEARAYSGCKVYLDLKPDKKIDIDNLNILVGYTATDEGIGFRGIVTAFIDHSMNRILLIDYKGVEVMVPVADEVLLSVDHKRKQISLKLPEGLISLNSQ